VLLRNDILDAVHIYVAAKAHSFASRVKLKLFADDTNLFLHDSDPMKLFTRANNCMSQLCEWFKVNKLSLNLDKTCYSIFGSNHKNTTAHKLYINDKVIQNVASCKYLGILIDSDLKWIEHIKNKYIYICITN